MKKVTFLNTTVHAITMAESLAAIEKMIESGKPHQQIVVNAAKIVQMQTNLELREAVNSSDLINADGQAVVWAANFLGKKLPERVAGIDLFDNLIGLCAEKEFKPYFFGAKEEVLQKLIDHYKKKHPSLVIAGHKNGYFEKTESVEESIAKEIANSKADMLFIAFGTPHKEMFLQKWQSIMQVPFAMGVGGSFDVVAGITKRAPKWMQDLGLEWFYRILQEPRRMWKRYAKTNPLFIYYVFKEKLNRAPK